MKARDLFELHGGAAPAPAAPTTRPGAPVKEPGKEAPPPRREPKFPNPFRPTRPGEKTTPKACMGRHMDRHMDRHMGEGAAQVVDDLLEVKLYARPDPTYGVGLPSRQPRKEFGLGGGPAANEPGQKRCGKCGKPHSGATNYCPSCQPPRAGASQSTSSAAPPNTLT